ncbi:hypothetical protein BgiMline_000868, partial [Biomphalaria glabrata]
RCGPSSNPVIRDLIGAELRLLSPFFENPVFPICSPIRFDQGVLNMLHRPMHGES